VLLTLLAPPPTHPPPNKTEYPKHVKVPMPALSPTMTTGNVGKYAKKIGDQVRHSLRRAR